MSNSPFNDAQSVYQLPEALGKPYTVPQPEYISEMPEINMLAFSSDVARQIGERENWTCEVTGKRFQDSFLLHIAHDHDAVQRGDPNYQNPEYGRCITIDTHLQEHIDRFHAGLEDDTAMLRLARLAYKNGLRTNRYYFFHKKALEEDRETIRKLLYSNDLNPFNILF